VLFDPGANRVQARVQAIVPGIPWRAGNPLSREIVATRQGRIYTYRGSEEPWRRARRHAVWVHDLDTGETRPTTDTATGGFWNGQSGTRDGDTIFLSTVNGELYRLETASGRMSPLGPFLPKAEVAAGERIDQLYGITLSADETRIYAVPRRHRSRESNLYAYEIATGIVTRVGRLEPALYAGSHVRDSRGTLYLGRFGSARATQGNAGLAILTP
jgi:outer membrane protein assembly factor BamB